MNKVKKHMMTKKVGSLKKGDFEIQTPKQTSPLFQWFWKTVETVFVADRGFDLRQGFNGILFILFLLSISVFIVASYYCHCNNMGKRKIAQC